MKTSLIIPAYNEERGLPKVIKECLGKVDEIVVVDDGSTDRTYEIAKSYNVKVLKHEKNLGKVAAIRTGIKNSSGEIIILTDADYTYPAKYMPQFVEEIKRGADLVIGSRFTRETKNVPLINKFGNILFSLLISYVSSREIKDGQSGYRAFKKEMYDFLDVEAKSLEYETKMTIKAAKLGYKIREIPIEYRKRVGKSKLSPIKDGFKMFRAIISIVIKETSLSAKVMMFPSIIFFFIGLIFGFISIYEKIEFGILTNEYYPMLSTLFILLAVQLFSLGLIIDNLTKRLDRIEEKLTK